MTLLDHPEHLQEADYATDKRHAGRFALCFGLALAVVLIGAIGWWR